MKYSIGDRVYFDDIEVGKGFATLVDESFMVYDGSLRFAYKVKDLNFITPVFVYNFKLFPSDIIKVVFRGEDEI